MVSLAAARCMPNVSLALLLCGLHGQEPAAPATAAAAVTAAPDLATLCANLRTRHLPGGATAPPAGFTGNLILQQENEQGRAAAELDVRYLRWQRDDKSTRPLLRYKIVDAAQPIERGRDRNGPWCRLDDRLLDLNAKENARDRAELQRHLGLAGQMVRFLDPAAVLADLRSPSPVTAESLAIGRETPLPCWTVSGELDAFPLLGQAGEDAPVRLRAFVAQNEHTLTAVEVTPLDGDHKPIPGRTELLRFHDHEPRDGRLLPLAQKYYFVDAAGKRHLQMTVRIVALKLDPPFGPVDFDRPGGK